MEDFSQNQVSAIQRGTYYKHKAGRKFHHK